jgi:threonine dehydrogenase-like Zn-dependent dehydrogenase
MFNTAARVADSMAGSRDVAEGTTQPDVDPNIMMRAITWQGPQMISCSMVPKPIITHPKDVIVQVTACAICSGSDLHFYAGAVPGIDPGFILGHEAMGIIVEKGEAVSKFNIGDRVVISCDISCGECDACHRQEYSGCRATNDSKLAENQFGHAPAAVFGFARMYGNVPGSQAEYVRVPIAEVNCCIVPESIPDKKALYISDVLTTSLHAVELGEVKQGDVVCIWGLGPIGLNAIRWCQIKGAKRVIGIDLVKERLSLAKKMFNIEVVDRTGLTTEQVVEELNRQVPGGADVCIEAVGFRFDMSFLHKMERAIGLESDTPEILYECFKVARPYGRISVIGDYIGTANQFPIGMIMMKHLTVASGPNPCQKYFKYVMDMLDAGEIDPSFMITHEITLEEAPIAYKMLYNKEDGIIKTFIRP